MSKELINSTWKELLDKFHSYEGTISDFCKENNVTTIERNLSNRINQYFMQYH